MPPSPRNSPALEVSRPGPATGFRSDRSPWEFLFGDGEWHPVEVRAWWTDAQGRQVVQIEWHAELDTFGGSFLVDPERMREG